MPINHLLGIICVFCSQNLQAFASKTPVNKMHMHTQTSLGLNDSINFYLGKAENCHKDSTYEAIALYEKCLGLIQNQHKKNSEAKVNRRLGELNKVIGQDVKAAHYFTVAYQLARENGDDYEIILCLNHLGNLYRLAYQKPFAREKYEQALDQIEMASTLSDSVTTALSIRTKLNLGLVLYSEGRFDSSAAYFRYILEEIPANHKLLLERAHQDLGCAYMELEQFDLAEHNLSKALQMFDNFNDPQGWLFAALDLTDLWLRSQKYERFYAFIDSIQSRADALRNANAAYMVAKHKMVYYEAIGNADSLLRYEHLYLQRRNQIFSKQKLNAVGMSILLLETHERDQKIYASNLKRLHADQRAEILFANSIILGVILAIVVMFLTFMVILYKKQKRTNVELVKKNLEIMQAEFDSSVKSKYHNSALTDKRKEEIIRRLDEKFSREKVYLNPSTTLDELAEGLDINRTYLSQVINQNYHKSFNQLIAGFRVGEARRKLLDPAYQQYSIAGIAELCGFGSTFSFNRIFKKETGLTPSVFQKNALKQLNTAEVELVV